MGHPGWRLVAIHGGGDWADASADYVEVPGGLTEREARAAYRRWYADEYMPISQSSHYMTFPEFIRERLGGRIGDMEVWNDA